MRSHKRE